MGKANFNEEFKRDAVAQITGAISCGPGLVAFSDPRSRPIQTEMFHVSAGGFGGSAPPLPNRSMV